MVTTLLPAEYKLGVIGERIGSKLAHRTFHLPFREATDAARMFPVGDHFIRAASRTGLGTEKASYYMGAGNSITDTPHVYYYGEKLRGEHIVELLYIDADPLRLSLTWGIPEDLGTMEVVHTAISRVIQRLSGVHVDGFGRAGVTYDMEAPKPSGMIGIAQFRDLSTIETDLEHILGLQK